MTHPGKLITVHVDATRTFQTIDGFGVNINSRYWDDHLLPAMDLLLNDLGATLYRVDIWGKSNWLDPDGSIGRAEALTPEHQSKILDGPVFRRGWGMMRWLNQHGIQPYLTASGIVPPWMLGPDGKTLADFEAFAEMMATMVEWAKRKEGLDFTLFGPLNETDIGDPEGPTAAPADYVSACEALDAELRARKLDDIRLVVAEQGHFNADYLKALVASPVLQERIRVFGMHDYWDIPETLYREVTDVVAGSAHAGKSMWMTEFGDLEQSGAREWYVAWVMASRLFDQLEAGYSGALVWDAYDNYHDHNEYWTIYGLLRTGLHLHTPKKRYHAMKQVFRFVRPGFQRVAVTCDSPDLRLLAFVSPERDRLTLTGINSGAAPARLSGEISAAAGSLKGDRVSCYRTTETENCALTDTAPVQARNWPFRGIDICVPPASIFTITNVTAAPIPG
jgi:O-glycosyl hydrolase